MKRVGCKARAMTLARRRKDRNYGGIAWEILCNLAVLGMALLLGVLFLLATPDQTNAENDLAPTEAES